MKSIYIINPRESKNKLSVIVSSPQYSGDIYIRKSALEKFGESLETISGKSIDAADVIDKGRWFLVEEIKSIDKKDVQDIVWDLPKKVVSHNGMLKLSHNSKSQIKGIFSSSYNYTQGIDVYSIENASSLKHKHISHLSIITMIQNIITRGQDVNKFTESATGYSSNIMLMILEASKYKGNTQIFIDDEHYEHVEFAIAELKKIWKVISPMFLEEFSFDELFMLNIEVGTESSITCENAIIKFNFVELDEFITPPSFISKGFVKYKSLLSLGVELDSLLRICFNYDNNINNLKKQQLEALDKIVSKRDNTLAILKTSFGKSLIYQFASLLQPVPVISVFPTVSLIDDQYNYLTSRYRFSFAVSNRELKKAKTEDDVLKITKNKRMFLVTPERLENGKFQSFLKETSTSPMLLIFDEAHCVSEWGHDFRPAYLVARTILNKFNKEKNVVSLGLTATAAPHIQKDIARLISVEKSNIINLADTEALHRSEIDYNLNYVKGITFDRWGRSETYSEHLRERFMSSSKKFTQGIMFFTKAGDVNNKKVNSIYSKIAAAEMYLADTDDNVSLYTGKTKVVKGREHFDFSLLENIKKIYATKSFGMGINLENCDYVLLSVPPYSLEDLYQQSGRVGRRGQSSIVDIYFHDNIFLDPLDELSPYSYFLRIKQDRVEGQYGGFINILKLIEDSGYSDKVTLKYSDFDEYEWKHIKNSIAHLIVDFDIVDSFSTKYAWLKRKEFGETGIKHSEIELTINNKSIQNMEDIMAVIKNRLQQVKVSYKKTDDLAKLSKEFYNFYFDKLQRDKLIGINLLIPKLEDINASKNHTTLLMDVINEYYKTRSDTSDLIAFKVYEYLTSHVNPKLSKLSEIISDSIPNNDDATNEEIMEAISRYSIDQSYINIASIMLSAILRTPYLALTINGDNITNKTFVYGMAELVENKEYDTYDAVLKTVASSGVNIDKIEEYSLLSQLRILKGVKYE